MSRSIHQTFKGVLSGKSKSEIDAMVQSDDPDLRKLADKRGIKAATKKSRVGKAMLRQP